MGNLSEALIGGDSSADTSAPPAASADNSTPDIAANGPSVPAAAPNLSAPSQPTPQPAQPAPDLPRFNRFKAGLAGALMAGIPGAVVGIISPKTIQSEANARAQAAQANQTFASARAAHEVTMAHQADVEYQALPEKLQQEAEGRGLDNIAKAKQAGYLPIASVALDQGTAQNTANAKAALDDVQSKFGAVPEGLLYIHSGRGLTVMKLQDPNAALPLVNQTLRAQGMPQLSQDQFSALAPQDRDNLARQALTFTNPVDAHGEISQDALNIANARLLNVKAQPVFNGQDQLVSALQASVDHYQAVLDSGAGAAAIRAGKAKGAEAVAAQPGTTAAQVANIQATSGPEAAAAGAKAGAEQKARNAADLAALGNSTDLLGNTVSPPPGGVKEYNKRLDSFKKDADDLAKTEGTYGMFNDVLNDINQGKDVTGAKSVVALFNAIGLSATPLKGMGMRINSNTVQEHIGARGLGQGIYQKLLSLKNGDVITPQQIKDYASIALQARHDAYVNKINEAVGQGVKADFLLPAGNGKPLDRNTASIFYDVAAGSAPQQKAANARNAAKQKGWAIQ